MIYLQRSTKYIIWFAAIVILICSAILSAYRMGEPEWDWGQGILHGSVLSEFPYYGQNYLRWGYLNTLLAPVMTPGSGIPPEGLEYRFSHGNITSLLSSFAYLLFGVNPVSARIPVLISSLLGSIITALLAFRLTSSRMIGLAALAFTALSPHTLFYSRMPAPHFIATTLVLLGFYAYWRWFETGRRGWAIWALGWLYLAAWTDWIAYFAFPALALHLAIFRVLDLAAFGETWRAGHWRDLGGIIWNGLRPAGLRGLWTRPGRRFMLILGIAPVAIFAIYVLWMELLTPGKIYDFLIYGSLRTSASEIFQAQFTSAEWIDRATTTTLDWMTLTPLLLGAIWVMYLVFQVARSWRISPAQGVILALLVFGLAHNLVFLTRVILHPFLMMWHLVPIVAIMAAIALRDITCYLRTYSRPLAGVVVTFLLVLFGDQSYQQFLNAQDRASVVQARYFADRKIQELVPPDGTYAVMNIWMIYSNVGTTDRLGTAVSLTEQQIALAANPEEYDAIMVSHSQPPAAAIVKQLLTRYPAYSVAGYTIFQTSGKASEARKIFLDAATPGVPQPVVFGKHLEFLGYDMTPQITRSAVRPGTLDYFLSRTPELWPDYRTTMRLTLYWRKLSEHVRPYDLSVQLIPTVGEPLILTDQFPGFNSLLPTTEWPLKQIISYQIEIDIPANAPERRYGLWVGVGNEQIPLPPGRTPLPTNSVKQVQVGTTDLRPATPPVPAPANLKPEHVVNKHVVEDLMLDGYSIKSSASGMIVETVWQRTGGTDDYAMSLELQDEHGDASRVALDLPPPRLWEPGVRYHATSVFPTYTPSGNYHLIMDVTDEAGAHTQMPIQDAQWCEPTGIQARLASYGSAGDDPSSNIRITPTEPLTVSVNLAESHDIDLRIAWTGRMEHERMFLQVQAVNPTWRVGSNYKPLALIEAHQGSHGELVVRVPKNLTKSGNNTIEIVVPERAQTGWRAWLAAWFLLTEPLLADAPGPYQGWIELDTVQAFIPWPDVQAPSMLHALPYPDIFQLADQITANSHCSTDGMAERYQQQIQAQLPQIFEQLEWETIRTADLSRMEAIFPPPFKQLVREKITARISVPQTVIFSDADGPVGRLIGYRVNYPATLKPGTTVTIIELFFEPIREVPRNLKFQVNGVVRPRAILPPDQSTAGYQPFEQSIPIQSADWKPGTMYVATYRTTMALTPYQLQMSLWKNAPLEELTSNRQIMLDIERALLNQATAPVDP